MNKLGTTGRAWLKGAHVLFMGIWVGAAVCMFLVNLIAQPSNGYELHGMLATLKLIDDWILIPSAVGSLLTGLLISWLTPWGFFKWRWVTVKWVLTVLVILFGTFYMGPWLNQAETLAAAAPTVAFQDPTLLDNRYLILIGGVPILASLLFMVFISIFKPWKRPRQAGTPIKTRSP